MIAAHLPWTQNLRHKIDMKLFLRMYIFFVASSFFYEIQAQDLSRIDSLKSIIASEKGIAKLEILFQIATLSSAPNEIINYSKELISGANKLNNQTYSCFGHRTLGVGYRLQGNLDMSLKELFKGADLALENGLKSELGKIYFEISSTYTQNNDLNNSLYYNSKAIRILKQIGDKDNIAISLLNTGFDYYSSGQLDTALAYYNEAEPIFDEIELEIGRAYVIGNRALIWWKQGDLERAERELYQAIEMLRPLGDQYGMADYYNQLGAIYLEDEKYDKGIEATVNGLEMAKKEDLKEQVRDATLLLSEIYRDRKEYQKAYAYHTQYIAYKDSIQDEETTRKLADLRTEFEVGQKQAEVDLLAIEKRDSQYFSVGLGVIILLVGLVAALLQRSYLEKRRITIILAEQGELLKKQKAELTELNKTKDKFFGIISHDLRGPMSAFLGFSRLIKMYSSTNQVKQLEELAYEMEKTADRVTGLLNNLLSWALQQQGRVPFKPEEVAVSLLVNELIEIFGHIAKSKGLQLTSNIDESLKVKADRNMLETILRNLINNAIKFTPDGGSVQINAKLKAKDATIEVVDTGVGMSQEKLASLFKLEAKSTFGTGGEKGIGLGLQLVKEFTELHRGEINVTSEEGKGSTFSIKIPRI